jgi:hypothetical protein
MSSLVGGTAGAILGAGLIGGGISAIGSMVGSHQQAQASEAATQAQQNMFNQQVANEAPYVQAGYGAQNYLNYLLGIPSTTSQGGYGGGGYGGYGGGQGGGGYGGYGPGGFGGGMVGGPTGYLQNTGREGMGGPGGNFGHPMMQVGGGGGTAGTPAAPAGTAGTAGGFGSLLKPFTIEDFHNLSPAYQFQLQQGQQGILNRDAGSFGALSGAAQKDLMGFNQGMAQDAFNNAFNQYNTQQGNIYQRLGSVAQLGQSAASNQATGASSFANGIGQSMTNTGTAIGSGIAGAGSAIGNSFSSALPWLLGKPGVTTG